jgi:hypothetical protein
MKFKCWGTDDVEDIVIDDERTWRLGNVIGLMSWISGFLLLLSSFRCRSLRPESVQQVSVILWCGISMNCGAYRFDVILTNAKAECRCFIDSQQRAQSSLQNSLRS